ncbi:2-phospho-L-lactate guanylyltransferase [Isoptericola haloaureus]|uniref:Phosphoenolpyruvate guanylyltransferase n=1 Tax=Isoptericola haloaureus TaxID=1542902 RepID=A0ABU7Z5A8_9MICO
MTEPAAADGDSPHAPEPGRVTAVVPLRDGASGKSRLATALEPAARRRLVVALARHVLGVLDDAASVGRVVVVTADVDFAREVLDDGPGHVGRSSSTRQFDVPRRRPAADVIAEPPGRPGLNAALEHARRHVAGDAGDADSPDGLDGPGADRLLVVHADLPLLTPADVDAVATARADVVVATDRHGTGTNLLAVPRVGDHAFRFGAGSRAAHEAEATRHGLRAAVVLRPGTAADLDTIDDVAELPHAVRDRLVGTVRP